MKFFNITNDEVQKMIDDYTEICSIVPMTTQKKLAPTKLNAPTLKIQ